MRHEILECPTQSRGRDQAARRAAQANGIARILLLVLAALLAGFICGLKLSATFEPVIRPFGVFIV